MSNEKPFDIFKELIELEANYHDYCNQFNIEIPFGGTDKVSEGIDNLINYFNSLYLKQDSLIEFTNNETICIPNLKEK